MKIGVNLYSLELGKIGGMEQYVRNLIWYVSNHFSGFELFLVLNPRNEGSFSEGNQVRKVVVPENETKEIKMYRLIQEEKLDLWFCPLLVLEPRYVTIPTVFTIPDLQHEYFSHFFPGDVIEWRNKNFADSARKADAILTLSNFSKKSIVDIYDIPESKVYGIYLDASKEFNGAYNEREKERIRFKYSLPEQYCFYPANTWPHKNHQKLLEALVILRSDYNMKINLVLTGSEQQAQSGIREFIKKHDLTDQVTFLGYIDQDDMPYIYLNSQMLVFPSLFEGFGIPLVEAMKTHIPIVCSNSGSIPEVVEDAALMFDPENAFDIARQIAKATETQTRETLIEKGKIRGASFSWEKCVNDTLSVFRGIVKDPEVIVQPLVTVVTPSYNQGKFIRETIESVLNQDYPNIEYIVMDGGSNDETVEILRSYGDRIKWVSRKDEGQADAVNQGILVASGDIIGWLNSDDTYLPGAISQAVRLLMKHNDLAMVYGEGYYTTETGAIIERYPTEVFNYNRLAENCFICQPTGFIKKQALIDVGLLKKELHLCMDYELWMRLGQKHQIAYLPYFMATSRLYQDNKTLSQRKEVFKKIICTVKNHYNYVPISWVYGLVDYKHGSARNVRFYFMLYFYFFYYNRDNIAYLKNAYKQILMAKIKHHVQGSKFYDKYEDGWVSKQYRTKLSFNNAGRLQIHGRNLSPFHGALKITILINNKLVKTVAIKEKGAFIIDVDLRIYNFRGDLNVEFLANRVFGPRHFGSSDDTRQLAYIIDNLELIRGENYDELAVG